VCDKTLQPLFIVLLQLILLSFGCGNQSPDVTEDGKGKAITSGSIQGGGLSATASSTGPTESESSQDTLSERAKNESPGQGPLVEVDWGREVNLDEMIAMAREDRIREIQWHVMPNILRAEASDGKIFHIKNENKGVDLRNKLIDAGVRIGRKGVIFRHVF
jgi:hypothetical protein